MSPLTLSNHPLSFSLVAVSIRSQVPVTWQGLAGWQLLFLVEGTPAVLLGVVAWFVLPDEPAATAWLTAAETRIATTRVPTTNAATVTAATFNTVICDPKTWLYGGLFLGIRCTVSCALPVLSSSPAERHTDIVHFFKKKLTWCVLPPRPPPARPPPPSGLFRSLLFRVLFSPFQVCPAVLGVNRDGL